MGGDAFSSPSDGSEGRRESHFYPQRSYSWFVLVRDSEGGEDFREVARRLPLRIHTKMFMGETGGERNRGIFWSFSRSPDSASVTDESATEVYKTAPSNRDLVEIPYATARHENNSCKKKKILLTYCIVNFSSPSFSLKL